MSPGRNILVSKPIYEIHTLDLFLFKWEDQSSLMAPSITEESTQTQIREQHDRLFEKHEQNVWPWETDLFYL